MQRLLVRIKGCPQLFGSLPLLMGLDLLDFQLLQTQIDLTLLVGFALDPEPVLLLAAELDLLEVLQRSCKSAKVSHQLAILVRQLFDLLPKLVHLVNGGSVAHRDVEAGLDPVVLLVDEVHLVLQLLHVAFVDLVLVLHIDLVNVLSALIQFVQAQNFVVSDLDRTALAFELLLEGEVLLDQVFVLVAQLIGSFIGTAKLTCPLLVLDGHATGLVGTGGVLTALFTLSLAEVLARAVQRGQSLTDFEALSSTAEDVVQLAVRVKTADDLILRGHVELLHDAVQFLAEFDVLGIELSQLTVFLAEQEFQILHLVLRLAALGLPLQVCAVRMLPKLDQLEVQVIVFFDETLVFFLQRHH